MPTPRLRVPLALAVALVAGAVLTGCGTPPWEGGGGSASDPTATPTATAPAPVPNDLSSGSTQRELQAGAVAATIDYWSTLSMDQWTPGALKPLNLSLSTTVTPDDGKKVYLQQASVVAIPATASGQLAPLAAQTDTATVNPGYLVLSPQSYSQTFLVGEMPAEADRVILQITYDFLMQTAPDSADYAKQTATDVLTVALTAPPAP
ncbi:hypothetical protein [Microbacterium aurantiacum]|uniref:Uncharacterized protein n=1 Tax=Microbacterium aurantiacum TaxID=162393 RepID=A0AAJ2LXI6_9MICO|nr:hypothetical protein [Microbacterium aurantiacum]MDS0244408.1 hypothetical protein [Microbacterium aurantiacum]